MAPLAFTPVRVVCQTTLLAALQGARPFVFRHARGLPRRLHEAGALVRSLLETTRAATAEWLPMAQRRLTALEARPGRRRVGRPQRLKEAAWEEYGDSLNDYLGALRRSGPPVMRRSGRWTRSTARSATGSKTSVWATAPV